MSITIFEGTDFQTEFENRTKNSLSEADELIIGVKMIVEKNIQLNDELNILRKELGLNSIPYGK